MSENELSESVRVAQMDAVGRLSVAIKRIAKLEAERDALVAKLATLREALASQDRSYQHTYTEAIQRAERAEAECARLREAERVVEWLSADAVGRGLVAEIKAALATRAE